MSIVVKPHQRTKVRTARQRTGEEVKERKEHGEEEGCKPLQSDLIFVEITLPDGGSQQNQWPLLRSYFMLKVSETDHLSYYNSTAAHIKKHKTQSPVLPSRYRKAWGEGEGDK